MVMKPTNSYERLRVSYIVLYKYGSSMPSTCFGHTGGLLHEGALQRIFYKNILNQCTYIRY